MTGIVSYGVYIPRYRIKPSQIAHAWGKEVNGVEKALGVFEKSVASVDEDAVTLAVEATLNAALPLNFDLSKIGAITVGSESHPYAVKPSAATIAGILGLRENLLAVDLEFACKAGTSGIQLLSGLINRHTKYVLAVGSDVAQARPSDVLEYTAGSAAASFILGNERSSSSNKDTIADLLDFTSFSSDTPDFWRRDTEKFPSHGGRFTGDPAYFNHVLSASKILLEKSKLKPTDFAYAIFHMPNGKFPKEAAKRLGFSEAQIKPGFIVSQIGNPYSASSMVGLAATLDIAKPKQKIFMCSYGSGAGSDSFIFETTPLLKAFQKKNRKTVQNQIRDKQMIDYSLVARNIINKYRI